MYLTEYLCLVARAPGASRSPLLLRISSPSPFEPPVSRELRRILVNLILRICIPVLMLLRIC